MRTHIIMVVWGKVYIQQMLEFALPALLAPGNLPAWPWLKETTLWIWTTPTDAETIRAHPVWQQVQSLVECAIAFLPDEPAAHNKYQRMNGAYQAAFAQAQQAGAALLNLMPDTVCCDGSLETLGILLNESPRDLVMCLSPRINSDSATPALQSLCQENVLAISPQQAVGLLLEHPHPITQGQFWDSHCFDVASNHIFYWEPSGQLAVQSLCLHPVLFVQVYEPYEPLQAAGSGAFAQQFDGSFLQQYHAQRERVAVIQNNQVLMLSLTSPQESENVLRTSPSLACKQLILDRFRRSWNLPIHHWLFEQRILLTPPDALKQSAKLEIQQTVAALQWFWRLESAFYQRDQAILNTLRSKRACSEFLPGVLQQAAHWYCQGAVVPNSPSSPATTPSKATLHQNPV